MFAISESLAMKTTSLIPIIIQAPLSFSLSILFIAVFDKIIFKTKLTKTVILQLILSIACSVLFAL